MIEFSDDEEEEEKKPLISSITFTLDNVIRIFLNNLHLSYDIDNGELQDQWLSYYSNFNAKNGIKRKEEKKEEKKEKEIKRCEAPIASGNNKGQKCNNKIKSGKYCKRHIKYENLKICQRKITSGIREGDICGKSVKTEGNFCSSHLHKPIKNIMITDEEILQLFNIS